MLSLDEIQKLSDPHPELASILRTNGPGSQAKPILSLTDIDQTRAFTRLFHSIASSTRPSASAIPYRTTDIQVRVRDGTLLPGRVYTPKRPSAQGCPGLYVCHGGGYVIGELDGQEWICGIWAGLGGVAVDVQYRHAPEWVFPIPVEDAYDGFVWMVRNLQELEINPDRGFIVAGDSNGADMAMVVAHLYALQQPQSPPLTGLYLACPVAMDKNTAPEQYREYYLSMEQNAKGPALTTESVNFIMSVYKPDTTSPFFFPILFPDHSKLPKTYLQVCGMDPLRDGGLILQQVLRDSGVQTRLQVYPGLPHCFWGPFIHAEFTRKHKQDATDGLNWLLSG